MKIKLFILFLAVFSLYACNKENSVKKNVVQEDSITLSEVTNDKRISLKLNPMQKQHQLSNMRSHLEAIKIITDLLAKDDFDTASKVAYSELGSTTEMQLMCASFGNKEFETLGVNFHKSADKMSAIFKERNLKKSLNALSNTMNYCIQCHATYRQ